MATRSKGSGYLSERSAGVWRLRVELGLDPLTETAKTYAYALKHLPPKLAERKARDVRLIEIERSIDR